MSYVQEKRLKTKLNLGSLINRCQRWRGILIRNLKFLLSLSKLVLNSVIVVPGYQKDPAAMTFSEDQFVKKLDRCLYDGLVKFSTSVVVGGLASLLFFKRKRWPVIAGGGFGLGYAYSNCQQDLNKSFVAYKIQ